MANTSPNRAARSFDANETRLAGSAHAVKASAPFRASVSAGGDGGGIGCGQLFLYKK